METQVPLRVRTPRGKEVIGSISQRLGGSRMKVSCMDGKTRICRIPGKLKKIYGLEKETLFSFNLGSFKAIKRETSFGNIILLKLDG